MPDVNAFNVLIQILSIDVSEIFSQGENLVAFVIAGKNDLDSSDDIKLITFELFSFCILILKSPVWDRSRVWAINTNYEKEFII